MGTPAHGQARKRGEHLMSKPTVRAAFVAVTTLFFAWGFITSLIDPLSGNAVLNGIPVEMAPVEAAVPA